MRKRRLGTLAAAMAVSMAAMIGGTQAASAARATHATSQSETKATTPERSRSRHSIVNEIGGIPMVSTGGAYGMSPKEYGMLYAHGPCKRHVNKLRLKHNAKLKRRR